MASGLRYRWAGSSLWSYRVSVLGLLGGRSSVRLTSVSGIRESGIVLRGVPGVYRWLRRRLDGSYGVTALGVMASSVVLGLVLGLGVQNHRGRLHLCHLVLQISEEWTVFSKHDLAQSIAYSQIQVSFVYDVDEAAFRLPSGCSYHRVVGPQNSNPRGVTGYSRCSRRTGRSGNTDGVIGPISPGE